jgi:heme-degrading monooxygenase HmoA
MTDAVLPCPSFWNDNGAFFPGNALGKAARLQPRNPREDPEMAYVTRTEFLAQHGRAHEFEALWSRVQAVLRTVAGFEGEVLLNGLGYPGKYVAIDRWHDRASLAAFHRGPALREATRSSEALYKIGRPEEAYEVLLTVWELPAEPGGWSQLVEWEIKPGAAGSFESSRKVLFDLRQRHGGIYASQLFRFLGNASRYLVMQTYENQNAERAGRTVPEIHEFFTAHPANRYVNHGPVQEYYTAILPGRH